jgi:hypothetical protein
MKQKARSIVLSGPGGGVMNASTTMMTTNFKVARAIGSRNSSIGPKKLPPPSLTDLVYESQAQNTPLIAKTRGTDAMLAWFRRDTNDNAFDEDRQNNNQTKVSLFKLLSFSTTGERWCMFFGLLMATLSGLGIPVWLGVVSLGCRERMLRFVCLFFTPSNYSKKNQSTHQTYFVFVRTFRSLPMP